MNLSWGLSPTPRHRPRLVRSGVALMAVVVVYAITSYLVIPTLWHVEIVRHPALYGAPRITHTAAGIHGDPLNVGLIATEAELVRAMLTAEWYPADPLTLENSLRIASSTVFHRPYVDAPVSNLYLSSPIQSRELER
jgi:hypothetical protein